MKTNSINGRAVPAVGDPVPCLPHTAAMQLSDGMFAWHLFGVLSVAENRIDLEEEAISYLNAFHPDWKESADADPVTGTTYGDLL